MGALKAKINGEWVTVGFFPDSLTLEAKDIYVSDKEGYYNTSTVEGVLSEIGAKIQGVSEGHWRGKTWYAYGTSLTSTAQGKYAPVLAELSGLNLVNKGIPGGAIVNNTNIKNAVMNITDGKLDADLITLEVGANDASAVIGTIYDTGNDTYCGALNQCIRYLQENTTAQIVIMSSPQGRYSATDSDTLYPPNTTFGTDNHTKYDQWKATREVCAVNGVPYIPLGEGSGLGYSRMNDIYLLDNIHHTEIGGKNLAYFIWGQLKNFPLWFVE